MSNYQDSQPSSAKRSENFRIDRAGPAAFPTGAAALIFAATKPTKVTLFKVTNRTGGALTSTVYVGVDGMTAGDDNIFDNRSVAANANADLVGDGSVLHLETGDEIHALGSGAGLNYTISYEEER